MGIVKILWENKLCTGKREKNVAEMNLKTMLKMHGIGMKRQRRER